MVVRSVIPNMRERDAMATWSKISDTEWELAGVVIRKAESRGYSVTNSGYYIFRDGSKIGEALITRTNLAGRITARTLYDARSGRFSNFTKGEMIPAIERTFCES